MKTIESGIHSCTNPRSLTAAYTTTCRLPILRGCQRTCSDQGGCHQPASQHHSTQHQKAPTPVALVTHCLRHGFGKQEMGVWASTGADIPLFTSCTPGVGWGEPKQMSGAKERELLCKELGTPLTLLIVANGEGAPYSCCTVQLLDSSAEVPWDAYAPCPAVQMISPGWAGS